LEGIAAAMGVAASLAAPSSQSASAGTGSTQAASVGTDSSPVLAEIDSSRTSSSSPVSLKNEARYQTYHESFVEGFRFLDRLIIQERDRSILPNMDLALGGLRQGIHYSSIRTDFVQHSLSALLEFTSQQLKTLKTQRKFV